MAKFRKRPVVIDAVRWDGRAGTANAFIGESYSTAWEYAGQGTEAIVILTLEGRMRCEVGDWLIRGVKGELYPCKDGIFHLTYEPADEPAGVTS